MGALSAEVREIFFINRQHTGVALFDLIICFGGCRREGVLHGVPFSSLLVEGLVQNSVHWQFEELMILQHFYQRFIPLGVTIEGDYSVKFVKLTATCTVG